jgi:hypothetical protein
MTATETSIANTLQTQNPDIVTDSNKKTLARTCVKYAQAAAKPTENCTSADIRAGQRRADHCVQRGDCACPQPRLVRTQPPGPANASRSPVYYDQAVPAPGCLQSQKPVKRSSCDEFPFWSTPQAFGGPLATAVPGIRWVPAGEQSKQGGHLTVFYNTKCISPSSRLPALPPRRSSTWPQLRASQSPR